MVGGLSTAFGLLFLGVAVIAFAVAGSSAFRIDADGWLLLSGPAAALLVAPLFLFIGWRHSKRAPRGPGPEDGSDDADRLLRHAMRVETLGDLAGMVAHQLRNHLQVMMGHAALASAEGDGDQAQRLSTIQEEIETSIDLLEQLLQLAHPDDGEPRRVELTSVCRDFAATVRGILPAALEFEVRLPDKPLHVQLDPGGLEHSMLNLVLNARHATEGRGQLTLEVTRQAEHAVIEVADTGSGIAAEDLERVFDPYFTTKPKGEGTGLGLAAVRRYVQGASGSVAVDSEVGRGTAFQLRFPLA